METSSALERSPSPASRPCTSSRAHQGGERPATPAEFLREATVGLAAQRTQPNPICAPTCLRPPPPPGEPHCMRGTRSQGPRHRVGTPATRPGRARHWQCSVIPGGHSHDVAITGPSSHPQNWLLAPRALGRPLHLLRGPALAPPGPAPHSPAPAPGGTHRRLPAPLRSASTPEELGKEGLVWSGPDGRNLRRAGAEPRAAPRISAAPEGGGGAGARSPAGEQRGAGMGPRASWVSGDRFAGEGPGRAT